MLVQTGLLEQSRLEISTLILGLGNKYKFTYVSDAVLVDALRFAFFRALSKIKYAARVRFWSDKFVRPVRRLIWWRIRTPGWIWRRTFGWSAGGCIRTPFARSCRLPCSCQRWPRWWDSRRWARDCPWCTTTTCCWAHAWNRPTNTPCYLLMRLKKFKLKTGCRTHKSQPKPYYVEIKKLNFQLVWIFCLLSTWDFADQALGLLGWLDYHRHHSHGAAFFPVLLPRDLFATQWKISFTANISLQWEN